VDGISAITSRIAEIRGTLAAFAPPTVTTAAATATTTAGGTSSAASSSTFATALASEVSRTTSTTPSGTLTAQGVPTELAAYGNGRVPREALSEIGSTGHRMWAPAARQYEALSAAAARDGVTLGITDSYRTYESQVDLAERKGLYKNGGLAAVPGTSDHGWGRSLDLRLDGNALAWMREHGAAYGFREDVPRESWHWTYYPPGS
jgi:zinc D-Ala-D-Ala carboxypeptidase